MSDWETRREREVAAQESMAKSARRSSIAAGVSAVSSVAQAASQASMARSMRHVAEMQQFQTEAIVQQAEIQRLEAAQAALRRDMYDGGAVLLHNVVVEAQTLIRTAAQRTTAGVNEWVRLKLLENQVLQIPPQSLEPTQRSSLAEIQVQIRTHLQTIEESARPVVEEIRDHVREGRTLWGLRQMVLLARQRLLAALPANRRDTAPHDIESVKRAAEFCEERIRSASKLQPDELFPDAAWRLWRRRSSFGYSPPTPDDAVERALEVEHVAEAACGSGTRLMFATNPASMLGLLLLLTMFGFGVLGAVSGVFQSSSIEGGVTFTLMALLFAAPLVWTIRTGLQRVVDADALFAVVDRTALGKKMVEAAEAELAALAVYGQQLESLQRWEAEFRRNFDERADRFTDASESIHTAIVTGVQV